MIIPKVAESWSAFKAGIELYPLLDVITISVSETLNEEFDLYLEYPECGQFADMLVAASAGVNNSSVIAVPPRPNTQAEPFIIYEVTRSGDGIKRVKAHSAVYRTNTIVIDPFTATGITATLAAINSGEFDLKNINLTDEMTEFANPSPCSLWTIIGALAQVFSAELTYTFDYGTSRMTVELRDRRGTTNDALKIAEGVNIVDFAETMNCEDRALSVYGYAQGDDGNGNVVTITAQRSTSLSGDGKPLIIDFTGEFDGLPNATQLGNVVQQYVNDLSATLALYGRYTVDVDFVPLGSTTDYAGTPIECDVGDTVTVSVLGKHIQERIMRVVFNPFTELYEQIALGSEPVNVADTIAQLVRNQAQIYNRGVS